MGLEAEVVEFAETTRTSAEAAGQIGCERRPRSPNPWSSAPRRSNRPVLVIASGVNRVDEKAVEALLGEKLGKADADFVRDKTGYAIGGVAPVGHATTPATFIDEDLLTLEDDLGGGRHALCRLPPDPGRAHAADRRPGRPDRPETGSARVPRQPPSNPGIEFLSLGGTPLASGGRGHGQETPRGSQEVRQRQ